MLNQSSALNTYHVQKLTSVNLRSFYTPKALYLDSNIAVELLSCRPKDKNPSKYTIMSDYFNKSDYLKSKEKYKSFSSTNYKAYIAYASNLDPYLIIDDCAFGLSKTNHLYLLNNEDFKKNKNIDINFYGLDLGRGYSSIEMSFAGSKFDNFLAEKAKRSSIDKITTYKEFHIYESYIGNKYIYLGEVEYTKTQAEWSSTGYLCKEKGDIVSHLFYKITSENFSADFLKKKTFKYDNFEFINNESLSLIFEYEKIDLDDDYISYLRDIGVINFKKMVSKSNSSISKINRALCKYVKFMTLKRPNTQPKLYNYKSDLLFI